MGTAIAGCYFNAIQTVRRNITVDAAVPCQINVALRVVSVRQCRQYGIIKYQIASRSVQCSLVQRHRILGQLVGAQEELCLRVFGIAQWRNPDYRHARSDRYQRRWQLTLDKFDITIEVNRRIGTNRSARPIQSLKLHRVDAVVTAQIILDRFKIAADRMPNDIG